MTKESPLPLPDAFARGPEYPIALGTAIADFWLEDNAGNRFKYLEQIEVSGTQRLHPKDSVQLTIQDLPSHDVIQCSLSGKAFVRFEGQDPVECLAQDTEDSKSTWIPLRDPLDIQHSDESGSEVQFLLFGFPEFYGDQDVVVDYGDDDTGKAGWWRCGRILLDNDDWQISISAHKNTKTWMKAIKESGGLVATHVGCIRKNSQSNISRKDTDQIITFLHYFLSFSRGHWQSIGSVRLMTSSGKCVYEKWGILRGGELQTQNSLAWWSPHPTAQQLSDVFNGFWTLWNDPPWEDALPEIIYWYLQANLAGRGHLGCDSALILSQATLEKLSWLYATQIRKAVSEDAFRAGKLRASDRLRLLATLADLPHEIPDTLKSITDNAIKPRFEDAFHAITDTRNQLVHSKKKQKLSPGAEFDAWNLSQWYVEMCLLRVMGYQGNYANRLRLDKWAGDVELVPWAEAAGKKDA
jgi:Apea-like HEPN